MVNEVKMGVRDAILGLFGQGWSRRRIARELGVDRKTVARHIKLATEESNCPTNPTPGFSRVHEGPAVPGSRPSASAATS